MPKTINDLVAAYNAADAARVSLADSLFDALCAYDGPGVPHVHFGGDSQPDAWSGVWRHDSPHARDLMKERMVRSLAKPIKSVDGCDLEKPLTPPGVPVVHGENE